MDDLARFRRAILGVWHFYWTITILRDVRTQLHQIWRGHRAIIAVLQVCFRFGCLVAFSNACGSKL